MKIVIISLDEICQRIIDEVSANSDVDILKITDVKQYEDDFKKILNDNKTENDSLHVFIGFYREFDYNNIAYSNNEMAVKDKEFNELLSKVNLTEFRENKKISSIQKNDIDVNYNVIINRIYTLI